MYLDSTQIKMYPSSLRDDNKDRNARLNSEQNIISVPNRLSDTKSYIISGLGFIKDSNENPQNSSENPQIQSGECCINGYYFNIIENISIANLNDNNYIYFKIKLGDSKTGTTFTQLLPQDGSGSLDDEDSINLDPPTQPGSNKFNFTGLSIEGSKDLIKNNNGFYYLLILKKDTNNNWVTPEESKLKYYSSSILYNGVDTPTSLNNYLNNIYCIDDGEL